MNKEIKIEFADMLKGLDEGITFFKAMELDARAKQTEFRQKQYIFVDYFMSKHPAARQNLQFLLILAQSGLPGIARHLYETNWVHFSNKDKEIGEIVFAKDISYVEISNRIRTIKVLNNEP